MCKSVNRLLSFSLWSNEHFFNSGKLFLISNFFFFFTGYSWDKGLDYEGLLASYKHCGFQATNFGLAVEEINKMVCK